MHLDAVQGSKEERASRTLTYGERVTDAADAAMRQKRGFYWPAGLGVVVVGVVLGAAWLVLLLGVVLAAAGFL